MQRVLAVTILTAVVAQLGDAALTDRFFILLSLVEVFGTITPVGFLAVATPALVSRASRDRADAVAAASSAARRVNWVALGVLALGVAALALAGPRIAASRSAFDVPLAVLLPFAVAAAFLALTARDAALSQLVERPAYLAIAPLAGNVVTLTMLLSWRGADGLAGAATAVIAGAVTHWFVLRRLAGRAVVRWLGESVSVPAATIKHALLDAERTLAAPAAHLAAVVILAGVVQGAASLFVLLARALVGSAPGAITEVSLALRIALLPPGLLAYPAWLATAPLLARPDLEHSVRRALLSDGMLRLLLAIGVVGGSMAGAAEPLVSLFFGQGGLTPDEVTRTAEALVLALPMAVGVGGLAFLGGPYQASARVARLAGWIGVLLITAAAGGGAASMATASLAVSPAAPVLAAMSATLCLLLPVVAATVPGGIAPAAARIVPGVLLACAAIAVGAWIGENAIAVSDVGAADGSWLHLATRLAIGGGGGGLAALLIALGGTVALRATRPS